MAKRKRKKKAEGQGINTHTILIALGIGVLCYMFFAGGGSTPTPQPDQDDVVVVDDEKQDDGKDKKQDDAKSDIDLKKHALVVIRDQQKRDVDVAVMMQQDDFWIDWCSENLADVEDLDDQDDLANDFVEKHKLSIPIVFLVNVETDRVAWQIPLPKNIEAIKEKLQ